MRRTAKDLGVIAQDVEKVFPELVNLESNGYKSVKYQNMVGILFEAVKELKLRMEDVERLKARVEALEKHTKK